MPSVNPKRRFIPLNNNAGAFTVIRLTTWAKYVKIEEDPAYQAGGNGQGLQGNYLDPFANSANITANMVPAVAGGAVFVANNSIDGGVEPQIEFGSKHALSSGCGPVLGNPGSGGNVDLPGGQPTLGTPLIQLRSNSANATGIIVSEYVA